MAGFDLEDIKDYALDARDAILDAVEDGIDHITNMGYYRAEKKKRMKKDPKFRKQEMKKKRRWYSYLLFPVLIFYYEVIFHLFTSGTESFGLAMLLTTLAFSACAGFLVYLVRSLIPFKKGVICTTVLMFVLALPFLIEIFVYMQFNIYYDWNTVLNGAGGVLTGFAVDALRLIFSLGGLFRVFMYLLPIVIYRLFYYRKDRKKRSKLPQKLYMLVGCLALFLFGRLLITVNANVRDYYSEEYNFGDCVRNFGLINSLRVDIARATFGSGDSGFDAVDANYLAGGTESIEVSEASEVAEVPKVYGKSQIDSIDFNALAESADGTLKELDEYCATLTASSQNEYTGLFKGKNLIFISAEAFSAEVISEELTPTLYRMATKGINFTDYYQPASAGTTGGEYENIFGLIPTSGGKSFKKTVDFCNYFTMGNQLNRLGYKGWAFHNNTYDYYSRDTTHVNLGYSEGYMGYGNGMEQYVTKAWPESDLEMIDGTFPLYCDSQPFNIYYMSVSGHSGYSKSSNAQSKANWDRVEACSLYENSSDMIKGYIAANLTLEDAMTSLINQLEEKGIADDTVIVIAADHFPYGLDDDAALGKMTYLNELYGYTVNDYISRDHNRLIMWCGCLEDSDPIIVDTPTSSLDIVPTLSNLFGTEWDSRLFPGRDVFSDAMPLVFNANYNWKTELGTYVNKEFTPVSDDVEIPEDYVSTIKKIVKNKMAYCEGLLEVDYYAHVMGVE